MIFKNLIINQFLVITISFLLSGQSASGQDLRKTKEQVDEALKLQREGRYMEAYLLLKEVERLNNHEFNQIVCYGIQCGWGAQNTGIRKYYFREYLLDTTKSILKGQIIEKQITENTGSDFIPFIQLKLTSSNDSTIIVNCDMNGEFLIGLNKGEYKLEITNSKLKIYETFKLTNDPYILFLTLDELTNRTIEFKFTKFELNDSQHYWLTTH